MERQVFRLIALVLLLPAVATAQEDPFDDVPMSDPIISRGDTVLTVGEVRAELAGFSLERAYQMRQDPEALRTMLNGMFRKKAMSDRAQEMAMDEEELARYGITAARDAYLARYFLEQQIARTPEPDFSILAREQYIANKEQYRIPEQIRAAHILIKTETRSNEKALEIATEVLQELQDGADFAEMVAEYSDDSATGKGGSLGMFGRGAMLPEFEAAAFALDQPGAISEIVQTQYGYHIIQLQETRPSYVPEYEEIKGNIIAQLRSSHLDRVRREIISSFDSRENVVLNEDALRALRIIPVFEDPEAQAQ